MRGAKGFGIAGKPPILTRSARAPGKLGVRFDRAALGSPGLSSRRALRSLGGGADLRPGAELL